MHKSDRSMRALVCTSLEIGLALISDTSFWLGDLGPIVWGGTGQWWAASEHLNSGREAMSTPMLNHKVGKNNDQ